MATHGRKNPNTHLQIQIPSESSLLTLDYNVRHQLHPISRRREIWWPICWESQWHPHSRHEVSPTSIESCSLMCSFLVLQPLLTDLPLSLPLWHKYVHQQIRCFTVKFYNSYLNSQRWYNWLVLTKTVARAGRLWLTVDGLGLGPLSLYRRSDLSSLRDAVNADKRAALYSSDPPSCILTRFCLLIYSVKHTKPTSMIRAMFE